MKVPKGIDRVPGLCIRCSGTRPCLDCPVGEVGDCDGVELLDIQVWATTDTIFAFDGFTTEATQRHFSSQHVHTKLMVSEILFCLLLQNRWKEA